MNASKLKSPLAAAAVVLSLLASAAQAESRPGEGPLGAVIAAQGDAALQQIRDELLLELLLTHSVPVSTTPAVPLRPHAGAQPVSAEARPDRTPAGA